MLNKMKLKQYDLWGITQQSCMAIVDLKEERNVIIIKIKNSVHEFKKTHKGKYIYLRIGDQTA